MGQHEAQTHLGGTLQADCMTLGCTVLTRFHATLAQRTSAVVGPGKKKGPNSNQV